MSCSRPLTLLPRLTRLTRLRSCGNETAYAVLLTVHDGPASTEISRHGSWMGRTETQLRLLRMLLRSLRLSEERCHREVLILVGGPVRTLFDGGDEADAQCKARRHSACRAARAFIAWAAREAAPLRYVRLPDAPLVRGVPSADKLHAFGYTQYRALASVDVDVLVLRDMSPALFAVYDADVANAAGALAAGALTMARHAYDIAQGEACGVPLNRRGVGALFAFRPNATTLGALQAALLHTSRRADAARSPVHPPLSPSMPPLSPARSRYGRGAQREIKALL